MDGTILRSSVYDLLQSGEPFDMSFVTCNRKKGTGGDLITVESWLLCGRGEEKPQAPGTATETSETEITIPRLSKDPHHAENGTVNIFNPANSGHHPVTVHIDLITFFNGKRVIN